MIKILIISLMFMRLTATVFTRLQIKDRPKGLHKFLNPETWPLTPILQPLTSTKAYVRNYKPFFAKRTQIPKKSSERKHCYNNELRTNGHLVKWEKRTQNEPKRTQNEPKTNPNEPKSKKAQMNVTKEITQEYENKINGDLLQNEPNSNPKQTQNKPNFIQTNYVKSVCMRD